MDFSKSIKVLVAFLVFFPQGDLSWAHSGFHTKTIRALLKNKGLYISIQVTFPSGAESYSRRKAWDTNGDGRLDKGEQDAVFNEIQSRFCKLTLVLDKQPLSMRRTSANSMGLEGHADSQNEISISLQFETSITAGQGVRVLAIADKPMPGTHSPIQLQAGKGIKVLSYSGRMRSAKSREQVSYVLDAKHKMVLSFVAQKQESN